MKQSNTDTNSSTINASSKDAPLYSASGEDAALDNVSGKYTLPYNSITKWLILALIAIGVVEAIIGVCSGKWETAIICLMSSALWVVLLIGWRK